MGIIILMRLWIVGRREMFLEKKHPTFKRPIVHLAKCPRYCLLDIEDPDFDPNDPDDLEGDDQGGDDQGDDQNNDQDSD